jgi:hypothetical protein
MEGFRVPLDVVVSGDAVWVSDLGKPKVIKFDRKGNRLYTWFWPTEGRDSVTDFKTALGSLSAIATFAHGCSNDFGDEALHCQTHPRVFAGQRCQGTSEATDDVSTFPST